VLDCRSELGQVYIVLECNHGPILFDADWNQTHLTQPLRYGIHHSPLCQGDAENKVRLDTRNLLRSLPHFRLQRC
jgi:hypothetical protein